jgi:hypothetical protein
MTSELPATDAAAAHPHPAPLTAAVVHELIGELAGLDQRFLTGERAQRDLPTVLEGYRWMFSILSVGLETFLWSDVTAPRFTDIVGFNRKWGGDNSDAFYQYAPIDPARTYRVTGSRADAVYFSLTVYGGPDDGRYSERIVGTVNDHDVDTDADGTFRIWVSPDDPGTDPDGTPRTWLRLEPDAVAAITRDYLAEPATGRRMQWRIELVGDPGDWAPTDESEARRFRAALTWLREQAAMVPVVLADPNTVAEPYPVPQQTFGWAAGDAAYAMGSYELAEDQALVVTGRSPDCAFWNLCLWNPFLHTYNYDHDPVTINGTQVTPEADGSWRIVVSERDPGLPNWVRTQGHRHGLIWFRWFRPAATPDRPTTEVVTVPGS